MDKRMVAIVEDLVRRILRNGEPVGDSGEIVRNLLKQGYAIEDIQKAFACIFSEEETISGVDVEEQLYDGVRIFSSAEEKKLSPEFRGVVRRLIDEKQITKAEAEKILLEALSIERSEVDVQELQNILPHIVKDANRLMLILPRSNGGENTLH